MTQPELFDRQPDLPLGKPRPCTPYTPGTGPEGETCKTCRHLARIRYAKTYLKCGLMEKYWTHGGGTDIKARWPACKAWEANG